MRDVKKRVIAGSAVDICGTIINTIVGFVILQYFFQVISKEDYGVWLATFGVASLIGLVDIGIDQYFLTIIPNDDKFFSSEFSTELSNFVIIKILIVLIFLITGLVLFAFIDQILDIPAYYKDVSKPVFLLAVGVLLINIVSSTASTILIGRSLFSFVNLTINLGVLVGNIVTLILLNFSFGILSFPLALLSVSVLQFFFFIISVKKKYPHLKFGRPIFKGRREMFHYSFSFQVLKWAFIIRNQSLIILLNNITGPTGVTLYNITNRIPQTIPAYINKIVAPLFPAYASYIYNNDTEKVRSIIIKVVKIVTRFSFLAGIGIILFNKSFIELWMGIDKYAGDSLNILLAVYVILISSCVGFGMIIFATKRFERWPLISVIEVFITLICAYVAGKKFGITGVFLGFLIGSSITQVYTAFISLRQLSITFTDIFKEVWAYVFFPNLISLIIGSFCIYTLRTNSWFYFCICLTLFLLSHFIFNEIPRFIKLSGMPLKERLLVAFEI